jgi:hypothetical protein
MFEIDMTWGATAKEVEEVPFFEEIPRLFKRFKFTFAFCFLSITLMITAAFAFPAFWQIRDFVAIFPLAVLVFCHFFLPVALNPGLMMLTW